MSATLSEATGRPYADPARVSGVGSAQGRGARAAGSDAHGVGRDAAGGNSGRSRPLAVPGRGPSEGPRAAADLGRDPGRADAGAAGDAGAQAALPAPRPPGHRAGACRDDRHAGAERDVVRVFTLDDGWGWIFTAVEHWNAECVGWHVCKVGSRFAALEPIAQGLRRIYGALSRAPDGPRQPVPVRLSQPDPVLGSAQLVEEPETTERWARSRSNDLRAHRTSRRYAQ